MRLALVILLLAVQTCYSQTCPVNLDFEQGDFTNWECFTGSTSIKNAKNVITLAPSVPAAGRHEIISAATSVQMDPYGNFPKLCPYGGNYSVKLGNESTGSQAEGLSYTFTVPSAVDTFSFTYFYAVVFQDPNHQAIEQPRFFVTAYDVVSGAIINCASYDYVSNGTIPGFQHSTVNTTVLFKNWTPASIQFAGLANRTVRLEFKTADCTLGGHFGYAYVDVGGGCSNLLATAPYCAATNSVILNAPYGFKSYTWYNEDYSAIVGTQQNLTLTPPPATKGFFHVSLIPYPGYGCSDTAQAVVTPLPVPDTPVANSLYGYCQFQTSASLTATASQGNDLLWYTTSTGGVASAIAPKPSTALQGTYDYYVTQKKLFGCESMRKQITVAVSPTPAAAFTINNVRQCQNDNQFLFTSKSTNTSNSIYIWDFGNGQSQSSADTFAAYTYSSAGAFNVKLKVINQPTCFAEKTLAVTVIPKPVAAFSYPPVVCEKQTPVQFINNSSVPGGVSAITTWWWNIGGAITSTKTPSSFVAVMPGNLPVKLVVTTAEGCRSDTNTITLPVHYKPSAALSYGTAPLCNNEVIQFTNLSALPSSASAENVVKWSWQFDNISSGVKEPALNLGAGPHHAKLIAESDFGCRSAEADSMFVVNAKPNITLDINDSCVFRDIKYSAVDVLNTVDKWYWDFGNGWRRDAANVTKKYSTGGYMPLKLLARTVEGCKDTIIRPFTIYDNKAFAGRDTMVAMQQPVQLNANGGSNVTYTWTPALGLSNASLENPVAVLDRDQLYHLDAISDKGCDSHSKVLIKRYKGPELYIPTAFTPNNDGLNDLLKVFPVGIREFEFLNVYNRYGQQVYHTTNAAEGWNGKLNGTPLETGTYVAVAKAYDYLGHEMINKVTVVLIR